jgi:hypothetical protein
MNMAAFTGETVSALQKTLLVSKDLKYPHRTGGESRLLDQLVWMVAPGERLTGTARKEKFLIPV